MAEYPYPPGPHRRMFAASLMGLRRDGALRMLTDLAKTYGDVSRFSMLAGEAYFVNAPSLIQEVLVSQQARYIKGRALQRARIFLGDSLLTSEGPVHRRQRRLVQPAFHRERIGAYAAAMVDEAVRLRDRWTDGQTIEMASAMTRLTLGIVARTLFSSNVGAESERIGTALTTLVDNFNRIMLPLAPLLLRLPFPRSLRLASARRTLDKTIRRLVQEKRASGHDTGDLLSMLVFAEDADRPGEHLTDEEVRNQALTLFLAGHETTANALSWTWSLLAKNPEAEARLHAELDQVLGGRAPTFEDLPRLIYTRRVIRESMRLYPPAWAVGRQAVERHVLGGYRVEKGTVIIASQWVMHRDERFFPDPNTFKPERWTDEFVEALPKFAYFPFGGGARVCIGESFAWTELVLVLATLAGAWRPRLTASDLVSPRPRITLRPDGPIPVRLEPRQVGSE